MENFQHPRATVLFGVPPGWLGPKFNQPDVQPMHAEATREHGHPVAISYWKPSFLELVQLNAGGTVKLVVLGAQPPVRVEVENKIEGD